MSPRRNRLLVSSLQSHLEKRTVLAASYVFNSADGAPTEIEFGTGGNDVLSGSENDDLLLGLAGDDTIFGRRGDDILNGGDGDDLLFGGVGDDELWGGEGVDTAVLSGRSSDYDRVSEQIDGETAWRLTHQETGETTVLGSIENISFQADYATNEFNFDQAPSYSFSDFEVVFNANSTSVGNQFRFYQTAFSDADTGDAGDSDIGVVAPVDYLNAMNEDDESSSGFGESRFGESGFGDSGFGESGFGDSGFGESGFGESGFGESGFGESGFGDSGFGDSGLDESGLGSEGHNENESILKSEGVGEDDEGDTGAGAFETDAGTSGDLSPTEPLSIGTDSALYELAPPIEVETTSVTGEPIGL